MTDLLHMVSRLEESGGTLVLDGERIRYTVPTDDAEARALLAELRKQREGVRAFLRARAVIPAMPAGVRLVAWELKEPPVAIEYHAIVIDPRKFARATLGELRERLTNPKRKYGWSVEQLIDRLSQVGVTVALKSADECSEAVHESAGIIFLPRALFTFDWKANRPSAEEVCNAVFSRTG